MANRATPATHQGPLSPPWLLSAFDSNWDSPITALNDSSLGFVNYIGTDTGSANNYLVTLPFGLPSAYNPGMLIIFNPANSNTGASVVTVSPLTSVSILDSSGNPLSTGAINAGTLLEMVFTGSAFQIVTPSIGPVASASVTGAQAGFYNRFQLKEEFGYGPLNQTTTGYSNAGSPLPWYLYKIAGSQTLQATNTGCDANNKCIGVWSHGCGAAVNASSVLSVITGGQAVFSCLVPALGQLDLYARVSFTTLPSATDNYDFRFGLNDNQYFGVQSTNQINLILRYNAGAGQAAWIGETYSGSTQSLTAYATTPNPLPFSSGAATNFKLQISINAAWNLVTFYVNGTSAGTINTNIPTSVAAGLFPFFQITKTLGSSVNPIVNYDKLMVDYQFSV